MSDFKGDSDGLIWDLEFVWIQESSGSTDTNVDTAHEWCGWGGTSILSLFKATTKLPYFIWHQDQFQPFLGPNSADFCSSGCKSVCGSTHVHWLCKYSMKMRWAYQARHATTVDEKKSCLLNCVSIEISNKILSFMEESSQRGWLRVQKYQECDNRG